MPRAFVYSSGSIAVDGVDNLQEQLDAKAPLVHDHTASQIQDSTTVGRAVLKAASESAARSAIGITGSLFTGSYNDLTDKPTFGGAASLNVGTSAGTVAAGNDSRIVDTAAGYAALVASADPNLDTLAKIAAALANDATFASTVATALAGKAAITQTPPIYVPTSLPLPTRASVIPSGYTGIVGLVTTLVPTITDAAILDFLTMDGDFVLELAP